MGLVLVRLPVVPGTTQIVLRRTSVVYPASSLVTFSLWVWGSLFTSPPTLPVTLPLVGTLETDSESGMGPLLLILQFQSRCDINVDTHWSSPVVKMCGVSAIKILNCPEQGTLP